MPADQGIGIGNASALVSLDDLRLELISAPWLVTCYNARTEQLWAALHSWNKAAKAA